MYFDNFEKYYQAAVDALIGMDETRIPDRDTVLTDFEEGINPQESAKSFYEDWNLE